MNAAGFESKGYWGFVVSDLSQDTTAQIASELAPPLKAALEASSASEARVHLDDDPAPSSACAQIWSHSISAS